MEKNDLSFGTDKIISVASMHYKEDTSNSDDDYMRTYNVMRLGDIAFEGNKSKNFAHGRFVENTIGDGIVSHVFDVFRPISEYDLLFWKYFINYEGVMGRIMIRCTKASTMMTNLVAKDFLEESIVVPSIVEQKRIGYYLKSLDHLITLHQSKSFGHILKVIVSCTLYWEQRKLGEVAIFSKGVGYSKSDLKDSGIPIILYGRLYTNYEIVIEDVDTFVDGIFGVVYSKGGEIITPSSGETSEDISIASVVKKSGILIGGDLNIIYPQSFLNPIFIAVSISNGKPHKEMAKRAQGKSVVHLHNVDLSEIEIDYPSIDEQTRISSYFITLDRLITLHQLEPFQLIFKAIAYRIIDYTKSKPPRCRKYTGLIAFIKYHV